MFKKSITLWLIAFNKNIMKKILLLFTLFLYNVNAQTLEFTYDNVGNQIQRELVTITLNSLKDANSSEEVVEEKTTMLPTTNTINEDVSIIELYPNPVVDLLKVEWQSNLQITEIMLFDNTGKLLQLKKVYEGTTKEIFDLSNHSSGMYYIRFFDSFQQRKTYKIIKK